MNGVPTRARAFIVATLTAGVVLAAWAFAQLATAQGTHQYWLFLAAALVASAAQVRFVEGPTAASSYNLSFVVYGFAIAVLGTEAAIVIVIVACCVDWVWHRYPWFIQAFNTAALTLAVAASGAILGWAGGAGVDGLVQTAILLASAGCFVLVNHVMVSVVIWLAKGERPSESGTFDRLSLAIDSTLTLLGVAGALLWEVNPSAAVIVALPLYLLAIVLRVPSLERQATTDPKTGLFNARYFQEALDHELTRANRLDRPLTVIVGDLDLLRNVNNVYGHLAGDRTIAAVAVILKAAAREYDVVARFGGEEFTVLFTECSVADAALRITDIRQAIAATPIEIGEDQHPIFVTMSFGLTERRPDGDDAESMLRRADAALYRAKAEGRNRVRVATGAMLADAAGDAAWDRALTQTDATRHGATSAPGASSHEETPRALPPATREANPEAPGAQAELRPGATRGRGFSRLARSEGTFVAAVVGVSLVAFALSFALHPVAPLHPGGLLLFAALCMLAEFLSVDVTLSNSSVSTAVAPFVAGSLLYGPLGVVALSLVIALAALLKHHSRPSRVAFNASVHLLAGLAALLCANLVGYSALASLLWIEALVCVVAALAYFVVTSTLVSGAISLTGGGSLVGVWQERFRWLTGIYLMLGVAAYAMVFGYTSQGAAGVLVVVVPLLAIRWTYKEHLERTASLLGQLRQTNVTLRERNSEISRLNEDLLQVISSAGQLRDHDSSDHSKNVAHYATLIAQELRLSPDQIELIRQSALLHDVGKLGVGEAILFKPGPLTPAEYDVIKEHPALSAGLLGSSRTCSLLAPIVKHHHERYDGLGYPDGLAGADIPLESRIVAVADAIDAMASNRRYRPGRASQDIVDELRANAGTQFDPEAVAAFVRAFDREHGSFLQSRADEALSVSRE